MFGVLIKELNRHMLARQHWTEQDYAETIEDLCMLQRYSLDALRDMYAEARQRYRFDSSECRVLLELGRKLPIPEPPKPEAGRIR
jgi:hypothetical protein